MAGGPLDFLGNLVSGVAGYFGAQENASAARDAANINAAQQERTNQENIAYQQEFAQSGIQWKVADAIKAGINPLAALGASTQSFSNVVAPQPGATNARPGDALTNAGQSVARAIQSTQSADDQAYSEATKALSLERGKLQNELLASQIRLANQPGNGPPTPAPSQVFSGGIPDAHMVVPGTSANEAVRGRWPLPSERLVQVDPDKVTSGQGTTTAGLHPEVSMGRLANGGYYPEPSRDMSVAMFNPWSQTAWSFRNMLMPMISDDMRPAAFRSDRGWSFNPVSGYYRTPPERTDPVGRWVDRHHWIY